MTDATVSDGAASPIVATASGNPAPALPAPGPDVVVPSAPAAPLPPAPPAGLDVPTRVADAPATPTQAAVAKLEAAVTAPSPMNHCAAVHATIRAWRVAKFSAILAAVGTWSFAKCINNILVGFRTLIVLSVTGALGLGDSLGGVDITGFIQTHYPNVKVGDVMLGMTILGFALRAITKTPLFQNWKSGRPTGSVDEPN